VEDRRTAAAETLEHPVTTEHQPSSPTSHDGLLCDSSLPGDDVAAAAAGSADDRLNGDVVSDDCCLTDHSTSADAGQLHRGVDPEGRWRM